MMPSVYCALVHYPVVDRTGEVVTTAVTNLDVHDIARSARTYGLSGYFVVTPIEAQRRIVSRIRSHFDGGKGARRVPKRGEALRLVEEVESLEAACAHVERTHSAEPTVYATTARRQPGMVSFEDARARIASNDRPVLIVLGTGHGLADSVYAVAHHVLESIQANADYNHLSVRAAAAIMFDRLFGDSEALALGK